MDTEAAFTALGDTEVCWRCPVLGREGRMVHVKLPNRVEVGSPVKIDAEDTLSLGEVSYCRPDDGGYIVWVELLESLHHVAELTKLAEALLA